MNLSIGFISLLLYVLLQRVISEDESKYDSSASEANKSTQVG